MVYNFRMYQKRYMSGFSWIKYQYDNVNLFLILQLSVDSFVYMVFKI